MKNTIKKFITIHYELEYERREKERHHFIAECHVDKDGDSSYYNLEDGTSMGSSHLVEYSLKKAIGYKTEEEKEKAIKQAQEILGSYM